MQVVQAIGVMPPRVCKGGGQSRKRRSPGNATSTDQNRRVALMAAPAVSASQAHNQRPLPSKQEQRTNQAHPYLKCQPLPVLDGNSLGVTFKVSSNKEHSQPDSHSTLRAAGQKPRRSRAHGGWRQGCRPLPRPQAAEGSAQRGSPPSKPPNRVSVEQTGSQRQFMRGSSLRSGSGCSHRRRIIVHSFKPLSQCAKPKISNQHNLDDAVAGSHGSRVWEMSGNTD